MSTDEPTDEAASDRDVSGEDGDGSGDGDGGDETTARPTDATAMDATADEPDSGALDDRLLELLAWVLDTETRARIYVSLRRDPWSTSREVAETTGLYPSTVREALAALHEDGLVERRKRAADGAGNNPYEYTAMAPGNLVRATVGEIQRGLNLVCNLDQHLGGEEPTDDPVRITVRRSQRESDGVE